MLYKQDKEVEERYKEIIIAKLKERGNKGNEKAISEFDKWSEEEKLVRVSVPDDPSKDVANVNADSLAYAY